MASATRMLVQDGEEGQHADRGLGQTDVRPAGDQVIVQADHEPADRPSGDAIPSLHEIPSPKPTEITLAQSEPSNSLRNAPPRGHILGFSDTFLCSQSELAKQGAKNEGR